MRTQVLLATDLREDAPVAYAHALRIAAGARGDLAVLHIHPHGAVSDWGHVPRATQLLTDWGMLPAEATAADFAALGIGLTLEGVPGVDPTLGIVDEVRTTQPDLLVMQAHLRLDAVDRFLWPSVSENVARRIHTPTLILPPDCRPFVSMETGDMRLHHVMVAAGDVGDQGVIDAAARFLRSVGVDRCRGTLLHLGEREDLARLSLDQPGWFWDTDVQDGPVIDAIVQAVADRKPDLLVVGTRGRDSVVDALLGSHAERILHGVDIPVLVVPLH